MEEGLDFKKIIIIFVISLIIGIFIGSYFIGDISFNDDSLEKENDLLNQEIQECINQNNILQKKVDDLNNKDDLNNINSNI